MKRKYGPERAAECLREIAELSVRPFVGMDLITGFPGESAQDFEETLAWLRVNPWSRLHVFPYSERAGTPATRLPGRVEPAERARRATRLRALSEERVRAVYQQELERGRALGVLFEGQGRDLVQGQPGWSGHTASYLRVWVPALEENLRNQRTDVRLTGLHFEPAAGECRLIGAIAQ